MNTVYRLVWNASLGIWVAVSELAKARGKGKSGLRRVRRALPVALLSITLVGSPGTADAWMVTTATTGANASAADGGKVSNTALGNAAVATGTVTLDGTNSGNGEATAVGQSATASGYRSLALGAGTEASQEKATAVGFEAKAIQAFTLAAGTQASASGYSSTAVGSSSIASGTAATALGHQTTASGAYSTAVGQKSTTGTITTASGFGALAVGGGSVASGDNSVAVGYEAEATSSQAIAMGGIASIKDEITGLTIAEVHTSARGAGSIALGAGAVTTKSNSVALGILTESTGTSTVAIGQQAVSTGKTSLAIGGVSAKATGHESVALGSYTEATAEGATALGQSVVLTADGQRVTSTTGTGGVRTATAASGEYSVAVGSGATSQAQDSIAMGTLASSSSTAIRGIAVGAFSSTTGIDALAMGTSSVASNEKTIAVGTSAQATSKNATALGASANATAEDSLALGHGAIAGDKNSVALGANSVTDAYQSTTQIQVNDKNQSVAGNATGTVSVGTAGQERTITNVAAGRVSNDSTDAINGSQLQAVIDTPMKFAGNSGAIIEKKLGEDEPLSITGEGAAGGTYTGHNLKTVVEDGSLKIQMTDTPDFTTVNVGENRTTVLTGDGLIIAGGPSVTTGGINAGNQVISEVADGVLDSDAVNLSQLKAGTKYFNANSTGADSQALGLDAVAIGMGAIANNAGDVALGAGSVTGDVKGQASVEINGETYEFAGKNATSTVSVGDVGSERTISNVAAGELSQTSTDAVNGSQLFATNQQVETNTTNIAQNTQNISNLGDTVENIYTTGIKYFHANSTGADSQALGLDAVAIGMGAVANNAGDIALGAGSLTEAAVGTAGVTLRGTDYAFAGANPTSTLSVGREGAERTITNVAAGELSQTSTDAVNGSQLFATNTALENLDNSVGGLQNDALLWDADKGAFSASHGSTTVNKITNVAAGELSEQSTDAVNGSQLFATNQQVETNTTNIAQNTQNISNLGDTVENIYTTGTKYFHANSTGADSQALGLDAVAIGMGAVANNAGDVALGAGSVTGDVKGQASVEINGETYEFAGKNATSTVSVGDVGSERTISNVAAGELSQTSTDAVNGSQLFATNTALENLDNSVGGLQNDALLWDADKGAFSASHGSATVNKITNVAAGELSEQSTDAVNGSQLFATNQQVETNTTNIAQNTQNISNLGDTVENIYTTGTKYFHANSTGADSQALGLDSVAIGMGAVANNAGDIALGAGSLTEAAVGTAGVTLRGTDYAFAGANPTSTLSVGREGAERTITNVAAGRLSETSTDAVNGSQLYATNTALENIVINVDGLKDDALLWDADKGAFSASHGSSVVNKITNVAAGELSDKSTDAVNGSQLYATNQKVENLDYRVTNIEESYTNTVLPTMRYLKVNSTGPDAVASGTDAIALGQGTVASGNNSIATGNGAQASGNGAIATGNNASASGTGSVAIGDNASVTASNSVALGSGSVADRDNTVSVGSAGNERQVTNVAAGTEDTDAVNVAQLKDATGSITNNVTNISDGKDGMFQVNNTSNYAKPAVTGSDSLAGGAGSSASGSNSMAVGTKPSASGENSVALGNGSSATAKNSVALGTNSVANRENSVSMGYSGGERQVTNVAAGTETTDAVNVGQLKQGVSESVNYTNKQFNQLKNMVNDQKDKLSAGIAGAMAMSSLPQPYAPGASMVGLGGGTYQGQSAVAFGVSTISDNGKWVTKVSGTTNSQGDFGASIGVGYQW
ncbi:YadA-like family protein [Klebsiella huaxiensis]|uniref:Autotransporter adhesin SadA n=1 Tax=Klebsiella huaxiensis TaxID=2153354 RepID=A0A564NKC9_9ENTR|nr:YadA-like family protein [Klebsiella huaxiensis]VUT06222.1 Autotransporter adhesin SadA [Klebsiella huaxiensis]